MFRLRHSRDAGAQAGRVDGYRVEWRERRGDHNRRISSSSFPIHPIRAQPASQPVASGENDRRLKPEAGGVRQPPRVPSTLMTRSLRHVAMATSFSLFLWSTHARRKTRTLTWNWVGRREWHRLTLYRTPFFLSRLHHCTFPSAIERCMEPPHSSILVALCRMQVKILDAAVQIVCAHRRLWNVWKQYYCHTLIFRIKITSYVILFFQSVFWRLLRMSHLFDLLLGMTEFEIYFWPPSCATS